MRECAVLLNYPQCVWYGNDVVETQCIGLNAISAVCDQSSPYLGKCTFSFKNLFKLFIACFGLMIFASLKPRCRRKKTKIGSFRSPRFRREPQILDIAFRIWLTSQHVDFRSVISERGNRKEERKRVKMDFHIDWGRVPIHQTR